MLGSLFLIFSGITIFDDFGEFTVEDGALITTLLDSLDFAASAAAEPSITAFPLSGDAAGVKLEFAFSKFLFCILAFILYPLQVEIMDQKLP